MIPLRRPLPPVGTVSHLRVIVKELHPKGLRELGWSIPVAGVQLVTDTGTPVNADVMYVPASQVQVFKR